MDTLNSQKIISNEIEQETVEQQDVQPIIQEQKPLPQKKKRSLVKDDLYHENLDALMKIPKNRPSLGLNSQLQSSNVNQLTSGNFMPQANDSLLNSQLLQGLTNQVEKNNQLYLEMLQEQEIKPDLLKMVKDSNKPSYNLEKGLRFETKTLHKHFQFNSQQDQTIPVMISVQTLDSTNDEEVEVEKENATLLDSRPSIDLVCVIDNSGSMRGDRIQNVKKTLLQLVDMLSENDRLSLILFNTYPTLLSNLRKVDNQNKEELIKFIDSIVASGGTNINNGMALAFDILTQRKCFNPVSSIFLLSDGQDKGADEKIQNYINNDKSSLKSECFTIHSFGFGSDHDGPLMNRISKLKDGNFYYVEKIDQVDEFFVDALGGLFSVVGQEILIEINLNRQDANFKKLFSDSRVSKTYGEMWKCVKQDEIYQISINQLFSGVSKDFIFEITLPKSEVKRLEDFERNIELIKCQLSAIPVDIQHTTKIAKDSNLVLTLFKQDETIPEDSEINCNVEFNYLRVKVAEAMEVAINFAEKKQYDKSQEVLQDALKKIEKSHPSNKEKISYLKKDILICSDSAKPRVYENEGKYKMLSNQSSAYNQSSKAGGDKDMYSNRVQRKFVMDKSQKK